MADRNISALTALDSLASGDYIAVWDASAATTKRGTTSQLANDAAFVDKYTQSTSIRNIVVMTQAAYDALATPDANTLYVIQG